MKERPYIMSSDEFAQAGKLLYEVDLEDRWKKQGFKSMRGWMRSYAVKIAEEKGVYVGDVYADLVRALEETRKVRESESAIEFEKQLNKYPKSCLTLFIAAWFDSKQHLFVKETIEHFNEMCSSKKIKTADASDSTPKQPAVTDELT